MRTWNEFVRFKNKALARVQSKDTHSTGRANLLKKIPKNLDSKKRPLVENQTHFPEYEQASQAAEISRRIAKTLEMFTDWWDHSEREMAEAPAILWKDFQTLAEISNTKTQRVFKKIEKFLSTSQYMRSLPEDDPKGDDAFSKLEELQWDLSNEKQKMLMKFYKSHFPRSKNKLQDFFGYDDTHDAADDELPHGIRDLTMGKESGATNYQKALAAQKIQHTLNKNIKRLDLNTLMQVLNLLGSK